MRASGAGLGAASLFTWASLVACGSIPPPAASPAAAPPELTPTTAAAGTTAQERLQGTWEIARYQSAQLIPDEAMPMMGTLFEVLRLRFDGRNATATVGEVAETVPFMIEDEREGHFTLRVPGGMFDGAECHFLTDGSVELRDKGKAWPGVSVLKRTR